MNRSADRDARRGAAGERGLGRRRLLEGMAAGGLAALSGCSGFVTENDRDPAVDGDAWVASFDGRLDDVRLTQPVGLLASVAQDVGFARHRPIEEPRFVLAESVEETASSVSITLRPGLEWSNGDPLTAADVGRWAYMRRMGAGWLARVPDVRDGSRRPRSRWEAITDVEWDERTVTVRGRFDTVGRPLAELNAHLGSHPRTYYDDLWSEFQSTFDDVPWEDEESWTAATALVDETVPSVTEERLPPGGIRLEDDYDGEGWEAAYSGLWYPRRTDGSRLHFAVNEAHPFADRVAFDEIVWLFRGEPDASLSDVRSGAVDGAMRTDVSADVIESAPSSVASFDGPASGGTALRFNHRAPHLENRDVRAALAYAVDRSVLADVLASVTTDPVAVPGADLQAERWAPSELRDELRSYSHDLDRARTLLERAGFRYRDDEWRGPDDEPFELVVLTENASPTLETAVADQLQEFGIDASMQTLEGTTYQTRLRSGAYAATTGTWSSPNAAGLTRTRTGAPARSIVGGNGFPNSGFLQEAVADAVEPVEGLHWTPETADEPLRERRLAFDSLDAVRAITVDAPPLGEPDGELREWPYLYHAVAAETALEETDAIEHAKRCTWIYNYLLPQLELVVDVPRIFHDTAEWDVPPADDEAWQYVQSERQPGGLWAALGWGHVDAA